ncbi:hypothetical protein [Paenibacillus sp. OV219]|uniref:hypothetical protein n=1 Tax=Paenibacillus sp. OV219 TaxID=1884377 RepID=UPI001160DDA7|nr:hypothetical protein [Paenibacillus sp. OV219]
MSIEVEPSQVDPPQTDESVQADEPALTSVDPASMPVVSEPATSDESPQATEQAPEQSAIESDPEGMPENSPPAEVQPASEPMESESIGPELPSVTSAADVPAAAPCDKHALACGYEFGVWHYFGADRRWC